MLTKEFNFFTDNHKQLFEKYPNEYLIIQGEKVLYHPVHRYALPHEEAHDL